MSKSSRRTFLGRLGTAAVVPALGSLSSSAFSFSAPALASAEQGAATRASYDLLIAGGRVIDPGQNLSAVRDVAILHGRVARIQLRRRSAGCGKGGEPRRDALLVWLTPDRRLGSHVNPSSQVLVSDDGGHEARERPGGQPLRPAERRHDEAGSPPPGRQVRPPRAPLARTEFGESFETRRHFRQVASLPVFAICLGSYRSTPPTTSPPYLADLHRNRQKSGIVNCKQEREAR